MLGETVACATVFPHLYTLSYIMQVQCYLPPLPAVFFTFELLKVQTLGSLFTIEMQNWLVSYLILLTHILALFLVSLTQTVGHKTATLTVVIWQFSDVELFNKQDKKLKMGYVSIFYSIPVIRACSASWLQCPL